MAKLLFGFFTDICDAVEIWDLHEGRETYEDNLWIALESFFLEVFVVNIAILGDAIADKIIDVGRKCDRGAMGEMPASRE